MSTLVYSHNETVGVPQICLEMSLVEAWYSLEQYIGLVCLPPNQCTVPENTKLLQD